MGNGRGYHEQHRVRFYKVVNDIPSMLTPPRFDGRTIRVDKATERGSGGGGGELGSQGSGYSGGRGEQS